MTEIERRGKRAPPLVLVADDEASIRMIAERVLTKAGFAVVTAADGNEAVKLFNARAAEFAAVVLDLSMPGMSGEEALAAIRQTRPDPAVIVCSGTSDECEIAPPKVAAFI